MFEICFYNLLHMRVTRSHGYPFGTKLADKYCRLSLLVAQPPEQAADSRYNAGLVKQFTASCTWRTRLWQREVVVPELAFGPCMSSGVNALAPQSMKEAAVPHHKT